MPIPVAESLATRIVVVLRGRPVPTSGSGAGFIKSTDLGTVLKQHVQLTLRWNTECSDRFSMTFKPRGIIHRLLPFHGQRLICRTHIHRLIRIWRNATEDRTIIHLVANLGFRLHLWLWDNIIHWSMQRHWRIPVHINAAIGIKLNLDPAAHDCNFCTSSEPIGQMRL